MSEIQSLADEIQKITSSVAWWNNWGVIIGMAATAIAASWLVIAQLQVTRESKKLSKVQDDLMRAKDEKVARDLSDKAVQIAELTKETEEARRETAEAKLELAKYRQPRQLQSDKRDELAGKLKAFGGIEFDLAAKDAEPLDLALSIEAALTNAGWKVRTWSDPGVTTGLPGRNFRVGAIVLHGIDVQIRDPTITSARDELVKGLTAAGLEDVRGSIAEAPAGSPNRSVIHIMVGSKK